MERRLNTPSRRTLLRAAAALCAVPIAVAGRAHAAPASFEGPGPIELGTGATHIQLVRAKPDTARFRPRRAVLHVSGLVARAAPGVVYGVRLSLLGLSQSVGVIAFADAPPHQSFDITDLLTRLARHGATLVVSILPHGMPDAHAAPRIGRVYLVAA